MEMHHRLRRDPSWHPSACNLCGQLGHQAANCTQGTINWKAIYGEDAFKIKEPIFPSEIYKVLAAKQVDIADLERQARDYAKKTATQQGLDYDEMLRTAEATMAVDHEAIAAQVAAAEAAAQTNGDNDALPDGWAAAQDGQGRTYYWHKRTQKTQWDRPTADTPIQ